ncbi:serine hydrolase domain-containing protein [Aquabacterium sp. OR-4]|uniref:serine hydrolase domain-containing protein n=1 Tax=Aquabacterium sp. OR-4 TaxID=2978127 RepID=UPI0021B3C1F2|nr:serine hydrolase domain-containing protein [Aquabacterium sp. OR-4]MDT7833659.1 serine hydrolase domain-containing protein [Aquabacterium sp. OR-4]
MPTLPTASPASQGLCAERLARIDRFLHERYVAPGRLPHAQLLVARHGQIVHQSVMGHAVLPGGEVPGRAMTEDTIVRIYSMTKPITSVAFMMLVEEGRVALDDPVHRFIPSWRGLGVYQAGGAGVPGGGGGWVTRPTAAPMRMIDLLRHTAGLSYGFHQRTSVDAAYRKARLEPFEQQGGLQDFVDALATVPLEFSPGTAYNYSVATDVLGYLVEQISGLAFADFLQQRILGPLGMVDTAFHVSDEQAHRLAECYLAGADGRLAVLPGRSFREPTRCPSGGGGLVGTAADYLRFCECLRRGGELDGVRLLGPKTLALMTSNHLPGGADLADVSLSLFTEAPYRGVGFGLGFAMTTDVARTGIAGSLGEYWWGGAASTAFWVDPVEDLSVVFMTQLMPSSLYPIRRELRTLVNAAVVDSAA